MYAIFEILNQNLVWFILGIIGLIIILFIFLIISLVKIGKLKKRIGKFMGKNEDGLNMEAMLTDYLSKVEEISTYYNGLLDRITALENRLKLCTQKTGLVRYNPFEDMGGDYCFALAMLNQDNDGIVINTIYSREGSYVYAKKVTGGICENNKLSPEERQAIDTAMTQWLH